MRLTATSLETSTHDASLRPRGPMPQGRSKHHLGVTCGGGNLVHPTTIPESSRPPRHADSRGFFTETFRAEWFPGVDFVQDNQSFSVERSTLRGLHYQDPPHDQAKLIQVPRGRIRDVAIDLRAGSPTFLQHVAVELSSEDGNQLLIPTGFAGFITLVPNTGARKVSGCLPRGGRASVG
jgi:hypothetical protein